MKDGELKFIHSGASMLNMMLTGHPLLGWPLGRISNIIGDKSTGKTLLAIEAATLFLENPPKGITDPVVVYHETEAAFDVGYAEMLGMPVDRVEFEDADTVEEFHELVMKKCNESKRGRGYFYVLDSLDSLSSQAEMDRDVGDDKTYKTEKQRAMGEMFRKQVREMQAANLHLMIISQIRENITSIPFAPKWRRSGGKALDFYASHVIWLAEVAKHKTRDWVYGIGVRAKCTKNKVARPYRQVDFPIIFEYGLDDITAMFNFLNDKALPKSIRYERKKGAIWETPFTDTAAKLEELVTLIEDDPELYKQLVRRAYAGWNWYEEQCTVDRMSKAALISNVTPQDIEEDDTVDSETEEATG
jgi:RecA/RadA recombinase